LKVLVFEPNFSGGSVSGDPHGIDACVTELELLRKAVRPLSGDFVNDDPSRSECIGSTTPPCCGNSRRILLGCLTAVVTVKGANGSAETPPQPATSVYSPPQPHIQLLSIKVYNCMRKLHQNGTISRLILVKFSRKRDSPSLYPIWTPLPYRAPHFIACPHWAPCLLPSFRPAIYSGCCCTRGRCQSSAYCNEDL